MNKKVDILNRDEFIQRAVDIVKLISSHKGNMTFAIDGAWGCGKTFVLEEIEDRLSNDPSKNYLVIPYNCWQYDYYDEPLVALVAALNDFANSTKVIPEDAKTEIKHIFGKVGLKLFSQIIKSKIGVDAEELISTAKEAITDAADAVKDQHEFDSFYSFKQVLETLHEDLKELTEKYTLVLAVDELDRCLPEYAIKVLERLHHVTENLPNTITIIAIDKKRLVNSVCSIFGKASAPASPYAPQTSDPADEYLRKFIRFEMTLEKGRQNGTQFCEKFPEYSSRFNESLFAPLNYGNQFIDELFDGIDIRTQEQLVEKATIFHDICYGEEKQDYTIMYMELFLAVLFYYYHNESIFDKARIMQYSNNESVFSNRIDLPVRFKPRTSGFNFENSKRYQHRYDTTYLNVDPSNVFMVIFLYWYHLPEDKTRPVQVHELIPYCESQPRLSDNLEKLRKNIHVLKIIR